MLVNILIVAFMVYSLLCLLLYFNQEKLIFFPEKLEKDFVFQFDGQFEEMFFETEDQKKLHGILFKSDQEKQSKGLIFYLHGNAGSLSGWGEVAPVYTKLGYDVFILDYRSYGKSEGELKNETLFFGDAQLVYDLLKKKYNEEKIVVLGYSIGTGVATKIASANNPRMLILQAPYYNLKDLMKQKFSLIPTFLLKYPFKTNEYIQNCKMPIVIFHGDQDEVIYYGSSLKLKTLLKEGDQLITLQNQGHNGLTYNLDYQKELATILE